eukprot:422337-Amphidinium_carterae.1
MSVKQDATSSDFGSAKAMRSSCAMACGWLPVSQEELSAGTLRERETHERSWRYFWCLFFWPGLTGVGELTRTEANLQR